jgi:hypothetical protein
MNGNNSNGIRKKSKSAKKVVTATTAAKKKNGKRGNSQARASSAAAARKSRPKSAAGRGRGKRKLLPSAARTKKKAAATRKRRPATSYGRTTKKNKPARSAARKVVRIMEHGQFVVDGKTLKRLNEIDNALVQLVGRVQGDSSWSEAEVAGYKEKLAQLGDIVMSKGRPLPAEEIVPSDIILPHAGLSIEEAKKIFSGQGVIPEIYA